MKTNSSEGSVEGMEMNAKLCLMQDRFPRRWFAGRLLLQAAFCFFISCGFVACNRKFIERTTYFPKQVDTVSQTFRKENVWVFVLAGQSNMAGRGQVEPKDTMPVQRLLTIDRNGRLIHAKEPLHFYEPAMAGLDCGYSFGKTMLRNLPDSIAVLLIPTAVGGSAISQWLGDSVYRNVKLFSNFREKVAIGKRYGTVKAVLWHQGESDANKRGIPLYKQRLGELVGRFRSVVGNEQLPVLFGEIGSFSKDKEDWSLLNQAIHAYAAEDRNTVVIRTGDLKHRGDNIHFNAKGQRTMGRRFARAYLNKFYQAKSI